MTVPEQEAQSAATKKAAEKTAEAEVEPQRSDAEDLYRFGTFSIPLCTGIPAHLTGEEPEAPVVVATPGIAGPDGRNVAPNTRWTLTREGGRWMLGLRFNDAALDKLKGATD